MTTVGTENYLLKLYECLVDGFAWDGQGIGRLDDVLFYILANNGCKFVENKTPYFMHLDIREDYGVLFISNAMGNDANEFYDFIDIFDTKFLIIFVDYFKFKTKSIDDAGTDDIGSRLSLVMGNSIYYDAIKKLVEIFYMTFGYTVSNGLASTAIMSTMRYNKAIIALNIINQYKPIDENDVTDMDIDEARSLIAGNINLKLVGIRKMDYLS